MSRPVRTTPIEVDSGALTRAMEVAREAGVYANRRDADNDGYRELIRLLCDEFHSEGGEHE